MINFIEHIPSRFQLCSIYWPPKYSPIDDSHMILTQCRASCSRAQATQKKHDPQGTTPQRTGFRFSQISHRARGWLVGGGPGERTVTLPQALTV